MNSNQHRQYAQEHKQAAKEEAAEGLHKLKDSGVDTGEYIKEKVLEGMYAGKEGGQAAVDGLGKVKDFFVGKVEDASSTAKANVVTATSFIKNQVEEAQENVNGAFNAASSAAGEFAYQAAETAKAGVSKAGGFWKSSTDSVDEKATGAQDAILNSASKVKDKGEKLKAKIGSYFTEGRESFMDQFHIGEDMSRAWKRFKSQLYTTDRETPPENNDREYIQDFVNSYLKGKNIKMDPSELVSSIYETLKDSKENIKNKIQDGANFVQDQASETFGGSKESVMNKIQDGAKYAQDQATETYRNAKDYAGIDYSAFTDSLNEAYDSVSKSPKNFWKSVYYKLSDSNHPLAESVSGLAKTPIPITSFYLSFFSFLVGYKMIFGRKLGSPATYSRKQVTSDESSVQVTSEQYSVQAPSDSYSYYTFMSDNFSWAPMAFINILALELNGYSNFAVHSIALLILSMESFSRFCPEANQYSIKVAIISVVMLSSVLNFFTALTGFPIIS